jgi:DNA sulfur modification protein DndD
LGTTSGVAVTLKRVEDEIRRANVNLVGLENKRDNIQKRLEGHDLAAVVENRRRYNQLLKRLGTIESDIKVKESQLQRLKAEAADYRNKISQASGPQLDRLNCEVSMYESMLAIFEGAIVRLRDQLKIDVERDATEVFLQLTTDPTYERLRINERYGLSIIREGDREVPLRSAGAEQIVALSLISALNQNAVRRGPVIMDTPFGRLDPIHRANVLKFITRMANQVILLVHSGEIDKESDVALISQYIDEEYEITRISGSRSAINRTAFAAGER